MIRRSVLILATVGVLVGVVSVVDYFVDEIDLYDSSINLMNKIEGNKYTINNLGSFIPAKVKGYLKPSKNVPEQVSSAKVLSGDIVITIPLYSSNIRDTFNETLFAEDGSFYIAVTRNKHNYNNNFKLSVQDLGRSLPKIVVIAIPESNVTLYIQCYSEDALSFFTSVNMDNLQYYKLKLDFSNTTDDIANKIEIDKSIYPNIKDMYLEPIYLNAVTENSEGIEGYSDFIDYKNFNLIYYKAIGFLDSRMKIEYGKLSAMGYSPIEAGTYKGISYIRFKELIVLGKPLTTNSSFIYHISSLQ